MSLKVRGGGCHMSPVVAVANGDFLVVVITADWEAHDWEAALAATGVDPKEYHYCGEDLTDDIEILLFTKEATA